MSSPVSSPPTGRHFLGIALLVALLGSAEAQASPALRKELTEAAKEIKHLLDRQGETSVALGQFTGPAAFPSSSGPGIAQILSEELKKVGVLVKHRAKLGIKGEYQPVEVPSDDDRLVKVLAVQLKITVEDAFGKAAPADSFKRIVKGETAFVELLGVPVQMTAKEQTSKERAKKLKANYVNPPPAALGPRIQATRDSPYAVEILIDGKPREAHDEGGLPFVKIARGETYVIRVINGAKHEAAVRVCIDGLNVFTFSEQRQPDRTADGKPNPRKGEPLMSAVVVAPKETSEIHGWVRTETNSDAFLVTEYARGAAASVPAPKGNLGTITVTFAACWPQDGLPPTDEPAGARDPYAGNATGFGARVAAGFQYQPRTVGAIRASVSVRYSK